LSLVAVGCDQDRSMHIRPNSLPSVQLMNPTSVTVMREKHDKLKELNVTIDNVDKVRKLYGDLRSSGLFPDGTISCPADFGINYTLTFKSGNKVVLTANADPNGCREIELSTGQNLWGVEPFWTDLAKSIGFPNRSYLSGSQVSKS
jgi:hypothetical protein